MMLRVFTNSFMINLLDREGSRSETSGPRSTVSSVSGCRYMSDCRSRGCKFDRGQAEIDHEIISTAVLFPSAVSRRVVVSYKRKYAHEVLVNRLVKFCPGKSVVR